MRRVGADDLHEISPYATFSMSSGAAAVRGAGCAAGCAAARGEGEARACALRLRSFARDPLQLAAPPPRPHLLAHPNGERLWLCPCFHAFSVNANK